jgi:cell division transport system ATP-binding protein
MEERMEDVLEKVGLQTKAFKMPHQLSGGEQQRVVIARALINDPDIILADEPTGNLDPESSLGIMELLVDISKTGRAILMATHDYTLFQKFPGRIFRCDNGKVVDLNPDFYLNKELEE